MAQTIPSQEATSLDQLLDRVYAHSGYDFRAYRLGTVMRRLARRLYATESATHADYIRYLDSHPEEYQRLANDLVIQVSGFFRQGLAFDLLEKVVLPALASRRASIIWSAACAGGEEAYSLAMLVAHVFPETGISVHASDISPVALAKARSGIYSAKEAASVPPDLLVKHFTPCPEGFRISDDIRRMVSFSRFDLTSASPPPVRPDCILCCNVLIYFQKPLQERVLSKLYDALATPGYLVLGEVESPPESLNGRLKCIDAKARIYLKAEPY